jgi:tRNA A37 threonylcarbamoyladenosine dehydratase
MSGQRSATVTGFVLGSFVTIVSALLVQKLQQKYQKTPSPLSNSKNGQQQVPRQVPAELREEQLSRHALYFGEKGMRDLRNARICIVGLGGVGSHTAHMLARSGVGYLRFIDFDQVTLSSLNRHACATLQDVGIPKVVCLQRFLEQICPDPNYLRMDSIVEMYTAESGPRLLGDEPWDMVIDAIDDVPTKAALLAHCLQNKIRVISCMGAAGKSDVTRLHISDLRTAAKDPLASKVRQHLKKMLPDQEDYLENMQDLAIVYSSEKTVVKLADFTSEQKSAGVHQYGAVDGMRIRVLPVLGTMPAIMGQSLAAMALTEIGDKPFMPVTGERVGHNVRNKIFQKYKRREDLFSKRMLQEAGEGSAIPQEGGMINDKWGKYCTIICSDCHVLVVLGGGRCANTVYTVSHVSLTS